MLGFGLARDFVRPRPGKAGPKPVASGQAKARTTLLGAPFVDPSSNENQRKHHLGVVPCRGLEYGVF